MNRSWGLVVSFDTTSMTGVVNVVSGNVTAFMTPYDDNLRIPAVGEFWTLMSDSASYQFDRPFTRKMDVDKMRQLNGDTLVSTPGKYTIKCNNFDVEDINGSLIDDMSHTILPQRLPLKWLTDLIDSEIDRKSNG